MRDELRPRSSCSSVRAESGLAAVDNTAPIAELMPVPLTSGVRAVSPNGVLGDPAGVRG
jgi:mycofactocin precursor peptide peptidase